MSIIVIIAIILLCVPCTALLTLNVESRRMQRQYQHALTDIKNQGNVEFNRMLSTITTEGA